MEGVTGMMARLRHVPGCSRGGLYGPANIDFPFVGKLRLQRAHSFRTRNFTGRCTLVACCIRVGRARGHSTVPR